MLLALVAALNLDAAKGGRDTKVARYGHDVGYLQPATFNEVDNTLMFLAAVLLFAAFLLGTKFGLWLAGGRRRPSRSVSTQSQCTYAWWTITPRFKLLPDQAHGLQDVHED